MDGCFPTALSRQSTFSNIFGTSHLVIVTLPFREIPFSHHKAAVYPWESWSKFLVAGCPSSHQPTRIREETLESGGPLQRKLNFRLRTEKQLWLITLHQFKFLFWSLKQLIVWTCQEVMQQFSPSRNLSSIQLSVSFCPSNLFLLRWYYLIPLILNLELKLKKKN